jgi:alpha-tubulin suppressor-like RCC1 family protein
MYIDRTLIPILGATLLLTVPGCRNDAESPTAPEPTLAVTATAALAFRQVSAGRFHSCGVTTDNLAYCWGYNFYGALGDGSAQFTQTPRPVPVAGGLHFLQVSAGGLHSCGVATDNRAYCWGGNYSGQLGNGSNADHSLRPVAVAGARQFSRVAAGYDHTCGVTTANRAFCWGWNGYGQIGDGSTTNRLKPVAVASGLVFKLVSAGKEHSCGLTTINRAYCWGSNLAGQIGDSSQVDGRLQPSPVAGGRGYVKLEAGHQHTCALTTAGRAYCWGNGRVGQIGDGTTKLRFWPRAVAGGLLFSGVSGGENHTCGVTTANLAYCWGANNDGELGDGTTAQRLKPAAVAGGRSFSEVSAGDVHTCGKTTGTAAYCWGRNEAGRLGDGTTTNRLTPVAVVGP